MLAASLIGWIATSSRSPRRPIISIMVAAPSVDYVVEHVEERVGEAHPLGERDPHQRLEEKEEERRHAGCHYRREPHAVATKEPQIIDEEHGHRPIHRDDMGKPDKAEQPDPDQHHNPAALGIKNRFGGLGRRRTPPNPVDRDEDRADKHDGREPERPGSTAWAATRHIADIQLRALPHDIDRKDGQDDGRNDFSKPHPGLPSEYYRSLSSPRPSMGAAACDARSAAPNRRAAHRDSLEVEKCFRTSCSSATLPCRRSAGTDPGSRQPPRPTCPARRQRPAGCSS